MVMACDMVDQLPSSIVNIHGHGCAYDDTEVDPYRVHFRMWPPKWDSVEAAPF